MHLSEFKIMFEQMEKKNNLFYLKINDIFWWDLVRYQIYYLLFDELAGVKTISTQKKERVKRNYSNYIRLLINEIKYKYLYNPNKCKCIFFACSREVDMEGNAFDNISKDILNLYKDKSIIIESFATAGTPSNYSFYYNFGLIIKKIIKKKKNKHIDNNINNIIKNVFNIEVDFNDLIDENIKNYIIEKDYYKKFFKRKKPNIIFMVQNGLQKGMISAANELKIPIAELQHGLINKYHAAYNYSKDINYDHLTTFPKYLLCFSEYWQNVNLPNAIKVNIGNNSKFIEKTSHKDGIGIIFSIKHSNNLMGLTKQMIEKYPDKKFILKLHPNQIQEVSYLRNEFNKYNNVTVIYNEKNIIDILEDMDSVILIQSTTIYQALQSGCKAYIYKRQDYEIHEDLFENKNVYLFDNLHELESIIDKKYDIDDTKFFDKFNKKKLMQFANEIEKIKN